MECELERFTEPLLLCVTFGILIVPKMRKYPIMSTLKPIAEEGSIAICDQVIKAAARTTDSGL